MAVPPTDRPGHSHTVPGLIVRGKATAAHRTIDLGVHIQRGTLTATVSSRDLPGPCEWTATSGDSRSVARPPTAAPTVVTFRITRPTKSIVVNADHPPLDPGDVDGACVMTNVKVVGVPSPDRHGDSPTPGPSTVHTPEPETSPPANQRRLPTGNQTPDDREETPLASPTIAPTH